jgi:hypothetical protein
MRLKAYILAADPTWVEAGVLSYYDAVEEIVVSFDRHDRGWTGAPISASECVNRLRAMDHSRKMRFCAGDFARPHHSPLANETFQRQCALNEIGDDADWILQLDPDELLPNVEAFVDALRFAETRNVGSVEWPMRVLYYQLPTGQFLEICGADGSDLFEYPAPVAVRANTRLSHARRCEGKVLRVVVKGDTRSLQIVRPAEANEERIELASPADAILHNSWARTAANVRKKIASWGHNDGWRSWRYYYARWLPTRFLWRSMRNFHPIIGGLWPRLKPSEHALISAIGARTFMQEAKC